MQEILQQVAQGLGGLAMAHDTRQTALRHLEQWLTEPAFPTVPSSPGSSRSSAGLSYSTVFTAYCPLARVDDVVLSVSARIALMPGPWPPPCKAMCCTCGSAIHNRTSRW